MTQTDDNQGLMQGMQLMADLLEHSGEHNAKMQEYFTDRLTRERDQARVKYEIVYARILNLVSGTWMPTSQAIIDAMVVSEQEIEWEIAARQRRDAKYPD